MKKSGKEMAKAKINPDFAESIRSETTDFDRRLRRRINIDVADMQIALTDFKSNVIRKNFLTPFLGLIGLWLPIISKSEFKPIFNLEANMVEGMYIGGASLITAYIIYGWLSPFKKIWPFSKSLSKVETTSSPKELANILHDGGDHK